ncbi:MAG: hypothetical protein JSS07_03715 [Proteobacteria bacterium]|nr:hypothetical protein [Pseudomonadota bacterium]
MALFPLKEPLNTDSLIKTSFDLYRISVLKTLGLSIILVLLYNFILHGAYLFPPSHVHLHSQLAIFSIIIFFALTGTFFSLIDAIGKNQTYSFKNLLLFTLSRFISLTGCFFLMLFLPVLILGFCIAVYIGMGTANMPPILLFLWFSFSFFLILAALISKIFAPILVFTDNQNANEANDLSVKLVNGYYFKTYVLTLLAGLIILFFVKLGLIFTILFGAKSLSPLWAECTAQILLILAAPWSFALLLTLKYDLQVRQEKTIAVKAAQSAK